MKTTLRSPHTFHGPSVYQITVEGSLEENLSARLAGMSIYHNTSETQTVTTLTGDITDQAELHGVLNTLYNYRYTVLSVHKMQ